MVDFARTWADLDRKVAQHLSEDTPLLHSFLGEIVMGNYEATDIIRTFTTGATRDIDRNKPDYRGFLSPGALQRFGEYMTEHRKQSDGQLRASDNWKKGIPPVEYVSSLLRHTVDMWALFEKRGYNLENIAESKVWQDLLCAILFNSQGLLHETMKMVRDEE